MQSQLLSDVATGCAGEGTCKSVTLVSVAEGVSVREGPEAWLAVSRSGDPPCLFPPETTSCAERASPAVGLRAYLLSSLENFSTA